MKTLKLISFMLLIVSMYLAPSDANAQPRGNRQHSNRYQNDGRDDAYQNRNGNFNRNYRNYPRRHYGHRRFIAPPPPACMHCRVRRHARASFCSHMPLMPRRMACRR